MFSTLEWILQFYEFFQHKSLNLNSDELKSMCTCILIFLKKVANMYLYFNISKEIVKYVPVF